MNAAAKLRGFAAMNPAKQKAIASSGGKKAHAVGNAHEFTSDEARAAGTKGGRTISANKAHMAEIGRKGGLTISANRTHMSTIGKLGRKNGFQPNR